MTDEDLESTEYLVTGRAIWIADSERDAELAALRERAAGLELALLRIRVECSLRSTIGNKRAVEVVEAIVDEILPPVLAAPADAKEADGV